MEIFGEFEIHDTFKITNHGIVLAGKIISENKPVTININDKISFRYDEKEVIRNIKGHERGFGRNIQIELSHLQNVAILIECESDLEIEYLKNWIPNRTIATLLTKD
ncbi:hypothetical protein K0U91_01435 [Chryseobacterium chendengshani]|uniref:hypothetical protein n=1 Tax=Chryseobacterium sp. LJ668 TaxID=2864040 RepID=UPI001C68D115|nr:hypothetical protein [Chryseobacterium sp. LJ668]MBW8523888.1 hypothetical protein [Chryseobacterium sp. LJ668]QYK16828.1 hypothetical protein K0U91_01435 [Chryseobacterium sp. LJ668]